MATAMPSMSATMVAAASTMIATSTTIAVKLRPAATVVTIIKVAITTIVNYPAAVVAPPVIGISGIAAVTDNNLVMTASVAGILCSVNIVPYPWTAVINYNFIAVV